MTSITRFKISGQALPKPMNVVHLTYTSGGNDAPIPLTFNKRGNVLDLDFSGDFNASTSVNTNNVFYVQGSTFTALHMVMELGPNFIAWAENDLGATPGSIVMTSKPVVVRANALQTNLDPNSVNSWDTGITTPVNFELAAGSPAFNDYYSTYLFKTPLVLQYDNAGTTNYAVMNTQFEGNT